MHRNCHLISSFVIAVSFQFSGHRMLLVASSTEKPKPLPLAVCVLSGALVFCLIGSISLVLFSSFNGDQAAQIRWLRTPQVISTSANDDVNNVPTNISHILFGIGSSVVSWPDRSHYSTLWWISNMTRGYVWLDAPPPCNVSWPDQSHLPPYQISEQFKYASSTSTTKIAVRLSRILLESFRLELPNVRWFVMGDDDTVFFPDNLVVVLGRYDHRKMWYIGSNSESVEQDTTHGYGMAFGGGGFAISYPLAAEVANILDGCLIRYDTFYGSDERIRSCVSEVGVTLTREPGFHQMDIRGMPYGLLVAHPLATLVTLHHIDIVDPIFPHLTKFDSIRTLMGPYEVDPLRTLQQSFCYDRTLKWSISISWGYSVIIYPSLVTADVLERPLQTFKTWSTFSDGPFTFKTQTTGSDPCGWPVIYFLDRVQVEVGQDGSVRTTYNISEAVERENQCTTADYLRIVQVKRIEVSSLKMDAEDWKQAPRRQCCEIMETSMSGRMQIKIRKCKPQETITI